MSNGAVFSIHNWLLSPLNLWMISVTNLHMDGIVQARTNRDKMAAIFRTTFGSAFTWMKMYKLRLRFHWSLFPMFQLTVFQHWFRLMGTDTKSNSGRVRECLPKVFFNEDLIERINHSHQPPHHGKRGAINLQSGATWPNCFCNCWGLATKPFALSEKITRGSPRRAKRRNANNVCSVDSDSTNSRCTARITPQVKSNTQNFLRGKS